MPARRFPTEGTTVRRGGGTQFTVGSGIVPDRLQRGSVAVAARTILQLHQPHCLEEFEAVGRLPQGVDQRRSCSPARGGHRTIVRSR